MAGLRQYFELHISLALEFTRVRKQAKRSVAHRVKTKG